MDYRFLVPFSHRQRSAYCVQCHRATTSCRQCREMIFAGPDVWNSVPVPRTLRQPDMRFGQFKRLLKHFFLSETAEH